MSQIPASDLRLLCLNHVEPVDMEVENEDESGSAIATYRCVQCNNRIGASLNEDSDTIHKLDEWEMYTASEAGEES